ncbi:non-ribosomal peptide synthetase, partial [Caballeronia sp. dw_276]|uniref:non-ribosomal peptide synthetase n=1 Tax=Caballeronia sp. dw_276 TaxID=2719795 RepID=UPI001BD6D14F
APLFQAMLALQNTPLAEISLPGLALNLLAAETRSETGVKFDLTLNLDEADGALRASFEYDTDLFDARTIARLADHFIRLLAAIVAEPDACVGDLAILAHDERADLLALRHGVTLDVSEADTLHGLFEAQVARTPDAVAIEFDDERLTYIELDIRAERLAQRLRAHGVGPDVLVALCVERSPDMVVSLLAVLKAGGAYVPLDPAYPDERLALMLVDAAPAVVLASGRGRDRLASYQGLVLSVAELESAADMPVDASGRSPVEGRHLAYVTYTSGSTGKPKGVMTLHASAVNYLLFNRTEYGLAAGERVLQIPTLSFDAAVRDILGCLVAGGRLVLLGEDAAKDPLVIARRLVERRITAILSITPSLLEATVAAAAAAATDRPALRLVLTSGERLPESLVRRVHAVLGAAVVNQYGPTECTMTSMYARMPVGEAVHIGRPIANAQAMIFDPRGEPVPLGVVGELHIGGVGLARGYLNRADLSAERFVPDPFGEPGSRMYRTGDLASYRPDGNIDYVGRIDHQIKVRGFRVEPGEIEAALATHALVREAVVLARNLADDDHRLVAYIVSHDTTLDVAALRTHLRQILPDYMVPSYFVALDRWPLTPNGKLDRAALPAPDTSNTATGYVEPNTGTQKTLADIWRAVLKLDRVGAHDHFFDLGGHSLLATQVLSRLRETLGVELPLRSMFEAPMLADLAVLADAARQGADALLPSITQANRDVALPLSYAQQRLWFLDQLEPGSAFYNLPVAVRLHGALDVSALHRTLDEVVRRHEVLRTRFVAHDGVPVQVIMPATPLDLPLMDLSGLAVEEREAALQALLANAARASFDLADDAPIRAHLVKLDAQQHVVSVTLHHIVSDGWSTGVLVREVGALYAAFSRGEPAPLTALPVQYADYAFWQRQWLTGAVLARQLDYWQARLAGAPTLLNLPTDRPRAPVQLHRGAAHGFGIAAPLTDALRHAGRRAQTTLFMTLASGFAVLLSRYSGDTDISIGTPIANRTRAQTEDLIGCFANTLVLREQVDSRDSFAGLLARMRETTLGAYTHQDVPFEQIVEVLQPTRSQAHAPLFQVMLTLHNAPFEAMRLPGLELAPVSYEATSAKFDLTLNLEEEGSGLRGT